MVIEGIKRGQKTRTARTRLSVETNRTIFALLLTLALLTISLATGYLFINNQSAQKAYRLSQVQEQNNDLINQSQGLEAKLVEVSSASNLEEQKQVENMDQPETRIFITKPR